MAWNAGTIAEVRTTGASTNGGAFYDLDPGTSVDYSQQAAAQLALTDVGVSGTAVSSVTGGFTAAMVGNVMYITGGGATAGWYQITAYTDTNNVTIDRSGGTGTNSTGNVGGAFALGTTLDDDFFSTIVAGNTVYFKAGTHTTGETVTPTAGAAGAYIKYYGYNTTRGDHPVGANRPIIQPGSGTGLWTMASQSKVQDLIFDSIYYNCNMGSGGKMKNCKWYDSSNSETSSLTVAGNSSFYLECEFYGTDGQVATDNLVQVNTYSCQFINCYFHSTANTSCKAIGITTGVCTVSGCVFDTVAHGVYSSSNSVIVNECVFYNCGTTGIWLASYIHPVVNCVFHTCTTGVHLTVANYGDHITYGCSFYNNTSDFNNGAIDDWSITSDPKLVDPANGDFTLDTGSPCFDAGISLGTHVGLAV